MAHSAHLVVMTLHANSLLSILTALFDWPCQKWGQAKCLWSLKMKVLCRGSLTLERTRWECHWSAEVLAPFKFGLLCCLLVPLSPLKKDFCSNICSTSHCRITTCGFRAADPFLFPLSPWKVTSPRHHGDHVQRAISEKQQKTLMWRTTLNTAVGSRNSLVEYKDWHETQVYVPSRPLKSSCDFLIQAFCFGSTQNIPEMELWKLYDACPCWKLCTTPWKTKTSKAIRPWPQVTGCRQEDQTIKTFSDKCFMIAVICLIKADFSQESREGVTSKSCGQWLCVPCVLWSKFGNLRTSRFTFPWKLRDYQDVLLQFRQEQRVSFIAITA